MVLGLLTSNVYAQWTAQDSLRLKRTLDSDGEVKLNIDALKHLDFNALGTPKMSTKSPALRFDESLPAVFPALKEKVKLTLSPYTASTKCDWDPIYRRKIPVGRKIYGMVYILPKRSFNNNYAKASGIDLMTPFTREFWNFQGKKNRTRAIEVLEHYGDSTQVMWREAIYSLKK